MFPFVASAALRVSILANEDTRKSPFCRLFLKRSDGLEPSTPSLPSKSGAANAGQPAGPGATKAAQEANQNPQLRRRPAAQHLHRLTLTVEQMKLRRLRLRSNPAYNIEAFGRPLR